MMFIFNGKCLKFKEIYLYSIKYICIQWTIFVFHEKKLVFKNMYLYLVKYNVN